MGTSAAESFLANAPGIRQVGDVYRGAKSAIANLPVPELHRSGRTLRITSPKTLGAAVTGATKAVTASAPVRWVENKLGNAPGVRDIGDWMRTHPEQAEDIITLVNAGLTIAQLVPLVGFGAEAVKAGASAVLSGLGKDAAESAARAAATEVGHVVAPKIAASRIGEALARVPETSRSAPVIPTVPREPFSLNHPQVQEWLHEWARQEPIAHAPIRIGTEITDPLHIMASRDQRGVESYFNLLLRNPRATREFQGILRRMAKEPKGIGMGTLGVVPPGTQVALQASDAVRNFITEHRSLPEAQNLADQLYTMGQTAKADDIRALRLAESAPRDAHSQALYHFDENPKELLTPDQKAIYTQWIAPLKAEADRLRTKLGMKGIDLSRYTPRQVAGRGGLVDRLLGEDAGNLVRSRSMLRKTTGAMKHRVYHALVGPDGSRTLVAITKGRVYRIDPETGLTDLGPYRLQFLGDIAGKKLAGPEKTLERLERTAATLESVKGASPERVTELEQALQGVVADINYGSSYLANPELRTFARDARQRILQDIKTLAKPVQSARTLQQRIRTVHGHIDDLRTKIAGILSQYDPAALTDRVLQTSDGGIYRIDQATTREIEAQTLTRYHKDAFTNWLVHVQELRRVDRAVTWLTDLQERPDLATIARKWDTPDIPKNWETVDIPQLRGYRFEPRVADGLRTIIRQSGLTQGGTLARIGRGLGAVNRFLRTAIFFNPLVHVPNVTVQWFVQRGATGLSPTTWARGSRAMIRALNAVTHFNDDYVAALEVGAPLQSVNERVSGVLGDVIRKTAGEIEQNPQTASTLEQALGFPAKVVVGALKGLYDTSGKVTWWSNDVLTLQQIYERMAAKGETMQEAIRQVARTIPDYRIPLELGALQSPTARAAFMFMPYHVGLLRAWGNMMRVVLPKVPMAERLDAANKLIALGVLSTVVYPKADQFLKQTTGIPEAYERRFGMLGPAHSALAWARGELPPLWAAESFATPTPLVSPLLRAGTGTAKLLQNAPWLLHDVSRYPGEYAKQALESAAGMVRPVGLYQQVARGKPAWQQALGLAGATFPKDLPTGYRLRTIANTRYSVRNQILADLASGNKTRAYHRIADWNRQVREAWDANERARGHKVGGRTAKTELDRLLIKLPTQREIDVYKKRSGGGAEPYAVLHAPGPVVHRRGPHIGVRP